MQRIDYPIVDPGNAIIITNTANGLILTRFAEIESEEDIVFEPVHYVYQAKSWGLEEPDWKCVVDFLWNLLEVLQLYTSKHHKKTINIEVVEQNV